MDKKKILIIIRLPPQATAAHEAIIKTINNLPTQEISLSALFFLDSATLVALSSKEDSFLNIQQGYLSLSTQFDTPLYVCGAALRERGLSRSNLHKKFIISGNMELSMLCASSSIVEF